MEHGNLKASRMINLCTDTRTRSWKKNMITFAKVGCSLQPCSIMARCPLLIGKIKPKGVLCVTSLDPRPINNRLGSSLSRSSREIVERGAPNLRRVTLHMAGSSGRRFNRSSNKEEQM
jgi:hypothetical protein